VDWLGEAPINWSIGRLKYLLRIRGGQDYKAVESADPKDYPVIGSGGHFTYATSFLYDGESVLLGRKGTIDKPLYIRGKFWTVDTMFYTEVLPKTYGRYAYYAATTIPFSLYSTNTALPSMSQFDLANHALPLPSYQEQTQIARFLDHETAKIDTLIHEQKRLIELLKEKRQAVISHAVTKGLDPDVPMKDSGVEWLGEVPAHWGNVRLKHLVFEKVAGPYGSSLTKSMYVSSGYKVYGQQQVISDDFALGDYYISEEKFKELKRHEIHADDVLISVMGTVGRVSVVPEAHEPGIINPRLVRYRFDQRRVLPQFVKAVLMSCLYQAKLSEASQGTTMEGLNMVILGEMPIVLPPVTAQQKIAKAVDSENSAFTKAINGSRDLVSLLQERRSALISAAVTGKIDVRNWQPPADESAFTERVRQAEMEAES
jgi:type I restriction enzyme S subunit